MEKRKIANEFAFPPQKKKRGGEGLDPPQSRDGAKKKKARTSAIRSQAETGYEKNEEGYWEGRGGDTPRNGGN